MPISDFGSLDFGPPPRKKAKKQTSKPKASNWFEKCTVEQLKQLCKAAILPVSGTKTALVGRLLESELSRKYSHECSPVRMTLRDMEEMAGYGSDDCDVRTTLRRAPRGARRPDGISTSSLQKECREKGLQVSGKRFDFVLRLLQHATAAQTGVEPSKAKGTFDANGKFQPKQRAKSMKLPDPAKLGARMHRMVNPSTATMNKWSNDMHKYHTERCVCLTNSIIQKEIMDKQLLERQEHKLVWDILNRIIKDGWLYQENGGLGYCDWEVKELCKSLQRILEDTKDVELLRKQGKWLYFLYKVSRDFAVESKEFEGVLKKILPDFARTNQRTSAS